MTTGNVLTENSAKFAQFWGTVQAGVQLSDQGQYHWRPPEDDLFGFSPHRTQPEAVSTKTATFSVAAQSATLTNEFVTANVSPAISYKVTPSDDALGFSQDIAATRATTYYVSGTSFSITQIDSTTYGSVFTQIDDDRERRAISEADRAVSVLPLELGKRIQRRLREFITIARDEGLETAGPSPDSARAVVNFLASMSADISVQAPSITLDSNGLVMCEWRKSRAESAVLRFLRDGSVGCALTTPAAGRRGRPNTWFAIVSSEELRITMLVNRAWLALIR
jgi:hypothetical protein